MIIIAQFSLLEETEALEMILQRLPERHMQRAFLEQQFYRIAAGKRGEERLHNRFKEFHIEEEFVMQWDVNLSLESWKVQIDGLLLTERCALIVESKNISDKIHFDNATGEFFRINLNGEKTVMEDPRVQLQKHIRFLKRWFALHKIMIPVTGLVVFTSKQCEFISKPPDAAICKTYQMPEYLLKIWQSYPPNTANLKLPKIIKLLHAKQTPFKRNPLCKQYLIDPLELRIGIFCSICKQPLMQRNKRSWQCMRCGERNSTAHHLAVREYFTLVDSVLTNQEFRRFCGIESRSVASRMLGNLNLEATGDLKSRIYRLHS